LLGDAGGLGEGEGGDGGLVVGDTGDWAGIIVLAGGDTPHKGGTGDTPKGGARPRGGGTPCGGAPRGGGGARPKGGGTGAIAALSEGGGTAGLVPGGGGGGSTTPRPLSVLPDLLLLLSSLLSLTLSLFL